MTATRNIQNIALIGFMGTGKSTIGRQVAEHLRFTFLDTDELIVAAAGKPVTEIFAQQGEAAFREMEHKCIQSLESRTQAVIATGGGVPVNPANLASLKTHALVVCLWASPEKIWENVRGQTHRPLVNVPDPKEKIRVLLAEREPFYRQADVLVNTGLRSQKEIAQQVITQFRLARNAR
ncbi:MAG: shikimate kinase [Verrucomicrobia bacterium]|nr:MAG: shikimate kinase [Verrucomicrobiota bacterium]